MNRVAFLINSLGQGGAERVFINDANSFAEAGDSVLFFMLYGSRTAYPLARELDSRIRFVELRARNPFDIRAIRKCTREMDEAGTRALISTLNDANIFARWVSLCMGKRSPKLLIREANIISEKTWWQRMLDTVCAGIPSRILAVSEEIYRSLEKEHPALFSKAILLPNAVATPHLTEHPEHTGLRILSVGSLTAQKDHRTLIGALGVLARAGIEFTATIVGTGALLEELQEQANQELLTGRINFTGALPHSEVLQMYAVSDIFALASLWEGSPNAVLEAMSAALPVVATCIGGISAVVLDNVTGILVPPRDSQALGNALETLAKDDALRRTFGAAGHKRIQEQFSPGARFVRLRDIVESL